VIMSLLNSLFTFRDAIRVYNARHVNVEETDLSQQKLMVRDSGDFLVPQSSVQFV
jgi:hypothetical protein